MKLVIDNSLAKGKALLFYLKAIAYETNSFITIEPEIFENKKESNLLSQIEAGLQDVKKMKEGKVPEKTLKQMLNEQQ